MNVFSSLIMMPQTIWMEINAKNPQQLAAEQKEQADRRLSHIIPPGYSRVQIPEPDGSYTIQRIYTADYLQYRQSDRAWMLYKVLYLLFLVPGVLLSVLPMLSSSSLNSVSYIGLLEGCSILPLLYLFYTMVHQIAAARRMTLSQYQKASKRMRTGAAVYGCVLLLLVAAMLLHLVTNALPVSAEDGFCIGGQLADAVLMLLIFGLETKRSHNLIQSRAELPENAIILD